MAAVMIDVDSLFPAHDPSRFTVRQAFQDVPHADVPAATGTVIKAYIPRVPRGGSMASVAGYGQDSAIRPAWMYPSPVIKKDAALTGYGCFLHPDLDRFLSIPEYKRLQSFPDGFTFPVGYILSKNQIGNSVPPLMTRAIASSVANAFGFAPVPSKSFATAQASVDYKAILDAAWADHLAPRRPDAPTVVSLFAGCGGSSLGYSMAGYRELLAVEWDKNACQTFRVNFPGVPLYEGDIHDLSVDEALRLAGIQPRELDLLDGSPPCQGLSTAGKRKMNDPRNQLFREYVRLLRGLQPKAFVMENVSGMVKGKMKLIFVDILKELKASGYQVKARLLNAMYYGVPQSRERMIFIGIRNDLATEPSHPKAETGPACAICATDDVIDDVNLYGPRKFNQAMRVLAHHNPSPTLTKSAVPGADLPFIGSRRIGGKIAARIQSFPDLFSFSGSWKNAVSCVGNSVPPLFMRSIASHVRPLIANP